MTAFLHDQGAFRDPTTAEIVPGDDWVGGTPGEVVDGRIPGVAPDLSGLLHWAEQNHEGATASSHSFGNAVASGSSASTQTKDDVDDALRPVALPAPKPIVKKKGKPVRTDRAPTVDDILDPQRPSLDGASHELVLQSVERLVTDIYDKVLYDSLNWLQGSLAKTAPPPATPFALTLLGWVVEQIASWTIGSIGKIAAKEMFGKAAGSGAAALPPQTPIEEAVASGAKTVGTAPIPARGERAGRRSDGLSPRGGHRRLSRDRR